jgi:hypothetical protein
MAVWWLAIDRNHCSYLELQHRSAVAQGWRDLEDLSKVPKFLRDADKQQVFDEIRRLGDVAYRDHDRWKQHHRKDSGAPLIFWNLLNLRAGDLVVALEGVAVRGLCELRSNGRDKYRYDPAYSYAHEFAGTVKWIDWNEGLFGHPPSAPRQGVKGIRRLRNESEAVERAWANYKTTNVER